MTDQASGNLTINKKAITAVSGTRTYDATTTAGGSDLTTLTGEIAGDDLSLTGAGTVADKNVGENKALTGMGTLALDGADKGNYDLTGAAGTLTVTKKAITVSGITASNKVYDATTGATVDTTNATGWIAGDDIGLAATGTFDTKNAGTGKTVTLTSSYSGADKGNYTITDQATTTANITKKDLKIIAKDDEKFYTGNAYSGGNGVDYTGFVGGETSDVLGGSLKYGGTSQGAVSVGTYGIDPYGLTSNNYDISFVNGTLTIKGSPTNKEAEAVEASQINNQNSINGTQDGQITNTGAPHTASMGPGTGSGNILLPSVLNPPSASGAVLTTTTFSAPVTVSSVGQTTILAITGVSSTGPMAEVGVLPVFTQTGGAPPALQGNFVVHQSAGAISLTPSATAGQTKAAPAVDRLASRRLSP